MLLLTGSTGFIGSRALKKLIPSFQVRCLVRPSAKINVRGNYEIVRGDLLSEEALKTALKDVDAVVHLAALLRKNDPAQIRKINLEGTRLLCEAAKKAGVKNFVYLSSENAVREDLGDAYASSKREAENVVKINFPGALILRPSLVYGPGDKEGLGKFIHIARKSPVVPLFSGLKKQIQPVYVDDVAEYILKGIAQNISGSYIVAGLDALTVNDFVVRACKAAGMRRIFLPLPRALYSRVLQKEKLMNIYEPRNYPINELARVFGRKPRTVNEGLRDWFSSTGQEI